MYHITREMIKSTTPFSCSRFFHSQLPNRRPLFSTKGRWNKSRIYPVVRDNLWTAIHLELAPRRICVCGTPGSPCSGETPFDWLTGAANGTAPPGVSESVRLEQRASMSTVWGQYQKSYAANCTGVSRQSGTFTCLEQWEPWESWVCVLCGLSLSILCCGKKNLTFTSLMISSLHAPLKGNPAL